VLVSVDNLGTGAHYAVYTDGSVEGFGDGAIVTNYHDALVDQAVERATTSQVSEKGNRSKSEPSAATAFTSDRDGAAQDFAE